MDFQLPSTVPQDLLLIQELIGVPEPPRNVQSRGVDEEDSSDESSSSEEDDISSSDAESEAGKTTSVVKPMDAEAKPDETPKATTETSVSTKEKEGPSEEPASKAGVKATPAETIAPPAEPESSPDTTSSDSSDSPDSDSDSDDDLPRKPTNNFNDDLDDDENPVPAATSGTYFQTKHELVEGQINVPDIDHVEEGEVLEKVGEIMNIIDQTVIIRGVPSDNLSRGSEKALDSDTLLVFEDRKVFGYIYETFGPTSQPLYQVKFNSKFPLDTDRVKQGREVFHVPARSHFVFMRQIRAFKGSDASNVYDEEPADDELEFSDDEAEAAYRGRLKRKRAEARGRSSSRAATPNPNMMRDQDLEHSEYLQRSAFDANGPYDIDFNAPGPSRPAPAPYDDPYADYVSEVGEDGEDGSSKRPPPKQQHRGGLHAGGGGGSRGRGDGQRRGRGNARGRGRPQHHGDSHRPTQPSTQSQPQPQQPLQTYDYNPSPSPSSAQMPYHLPQAVPQAYPPPGASNWSYGQPQTQPQPQPQAPFVFGQPQTTPGYGMPFMPPASPFTQPHINPRFASMWGMGMGMPGMSMQGMNMGPMGMSAGMGSMGQSSTGMLGATGNMGHGYGGVQQPHQQATRMTTPTLQGQQPQVERSQDPRVDPSHQNQK